MSRQVLNRGAYPNDPSAERLYDGVGKINDMTAELYQGVPHARYDIASPGLSASFRDDGTGNLGWYIGAAGALDGAQVKAASVNAVTGAMTVANGFNVAANNPRSSVSHTGVTPSTLRFGADAGITWLGSQTNSPLYFITNNVERARFDASGNLGIGTTAPATKLDVSGAATFTLPSYCYTEVNSGAVKGHFAANEGGSVDVRAVSNHPLVFYTNNTLRGAFGINGNFGIGTSTAPSTKLHVSGADATVVLFNGVTKGVRIAFTASGSAIEGVDNTGAGSYQPLSIGGSVIIATADFRPVTHNTYDLGTTALRWKKLWTVDAEFSNSPIVPNVTAGDSSQRAANTKFVSDALAELGTVIGQHLRGSFVALPAKCLWPNGQNVSRTTYAALMDATTIVGTVATTNTSTSATLTLADAEAVAQVQPGMPIEATGIQAGTTVSARGATTATTIVVTLSLAANATAGANAVRVFPFGNGNGTTTFGVADVRDRTSVGRGNMGGTAASRITIVNSSRLGGGAGDQFMMNHVHTKGIPGQNQTLVASTPQNVYALQGDGTTYNSNTGSAGSGVAENLPPLIVENVVIFAGV